MKILNSMKILSSGLAANRKRLQAISSNIANAQTVKTKEGGPYKRKVVVFEAAPVENDFDSFLRGEVESQASLVKAKEKSLSDQKPLMKYDPKHPEANKKGYVAYPDINVMIEMADLISTQRSYEANISAIKASKSMAMKALEIGK